MNDLGGAGVNVTELGVSVRPKSWNRRRLSVASLLSARVHTVCARPRHQIKSNRVIPARITSELEN
jgi:hypothetical protein